MTPTASAISLFRGSGQRAPSISEPSPPRSSNRSSIPVLVAAVLTAAPSLLSYTQPPSNLMLVQLLAFASWGGVVVTTYKTRIRPLVRNADLYHILPRPDGKNWDGIQYFDPATKKGVVYLFKPSAAADTNTLKLRGVEPGRRYRVMFEDGSNPTVEKTGEELAKGLEVTLKGAPVSELAWIEEINK